MFLLTLCLVFAILDMQLRKIRRQNNVGWDNERQSVNGL